MPQPNEVLNALDLSFSSEKRCRERPISDYTIQKQKKNNNKSKKKIKWNYMNGSIINIIIIKKGY